MPTMPTMPADCAQASDDASRLATHRDLNQIVESRTGRLRCENASLGVFVSQELQPHGSHLTLWCTHFSPAEPRVEACLGSSPMSRQCCNSRCVHWSNRCRARPSPE